MNALRSEGKTTSNKLEDKPINFFPFSLIRMSGQACKHLDLSLVDKYHCMYAGGLKPGKTYYYLLTSFTLSPSPILERLVDIVQDETIAFYFVPFLSSRPLSKQVKSSAREQIS